MELMNIFSLHFVIPLVVAAISALHIYYRKAFSYWSSRGIPQTTAVPIFGSLISALVREPHENEILNYKKYGRLYGTYEGTKPGLTVAEPDLVKLIMVKDFNIFTDRRHFPDTDRAISKMLTILQGEEWRRVRSVVSPSFTTGRIKRMSSLVNECASTLTKNFLKATETESTVDCKRYFGAFTMDTIANCAFGMKINSQEDSDNPFVAHARRLFSAASTATLIIALLFPRLISFLRSSFFPNDVNVFFTKASSRIMEERKKRGERGNDFLQLIMDARDGKSDKTVETTQELESHHALGSQMLHVSNKVLSKEEALAQCILFFVVGYDTTASTLTFVSYLLALNPDCQDKLIKEVDKVWEANNGKIDFEVVSKMEYLDAVICETLRLYSVLIRTERYTSKDYVLGDTGITVPKGTIVGIPLYAIHRDPEWYPEPDKFDPERFSPENKAARNPYTFMPFGAGPRNCIGMRFALMEAKLCLVNVLRHVKFVRTAKTKVPPPYTSTQGLLRPKEVYLKCVKRNT